MPAATRFHTGGLHLTQDEALEYCLHHLHLAGLFYMTASERHDEHIAECLRTLGSDTLGTDDPIYLAALAFLTVSNAAHTSARAKDPLND